MIFLFIPVHSEEEHSLIAQYSQILRGEGGWQVPLSPVQVMAAIDVEQREELETIIHELEKENRYVQVAHPTNMENLYRASL